eukprot:CAMPEP_0176461802 /NCGR_PEP_ID=MMETSP0127-20121128/34874_1 /TAXON_ID=938130 /ORGANISM="Platyophrya macrostoma, Strain WH" /LENGTH=227 /DNA_ID=CAMNT_0017853569 /DNA_START=60 /DNA_END=743 /DNA_ORIENTATION=-
MGKNTGRGGNKRKRAKNKPTTTKRELIFKEDEQEYAQVTKMLGDGRFECYCFDDVKRLANIRGQLKKRVWFTVGDIVLVSLREYQDNKCDAFHKFTPDEVKKLKDLGEIPMSVKYEEGEVTENKNDDVIFDYNNDESDDDEEKKKPEKKKKAGDDSEEEDDDEDDDDEDEDDDDEMEGAKKRAMPESDESDEEEEEMRNKMRMMTQKGGYDLGKMKKNGSRDSLDDI